MKKFFIAALLISSLAQNKIQADENELRAIAETIQVINAAQLIRALAAAYYIAGVQNGTIKPLPSSGTLR
jgi:hypothetical protein